MDLNNYQIIMGPWVSEKAYMLNNKNNQLVLRVHTQANKSQVKQALEQLFNVKVDDVRVVLVKGKTRRVGRHTVYGKNAKKAIIRLKPGYKIDVMGAQQVPGGAETPPMETSSD